MNLNKIALIRNSRGHNQPNVLQIGNDILAWGTQGLTVHPRPDGRHIRKADVFALRELITRWNATHNDCRELNVEGFPSEDFLSMISAAHPDQCTLVPDPPEALTSSAGWDLVENEDFLRTVSRRIFESGCRVSLFVDPMSFDDSALASLDRIGADRIELYTEPYARTFQDQTHDLVIGHYKMCALKASENGIGCNAGHDLNQKNLEFLIREVPEILEVSIGHALICEALYQGLETTIKNYLTILKHGNSSSTGSH